MMRGCKSQVGFGFTSAFLLLLLGLQGVSTASHQLFMDQESSCKKTYAVDMDSIYTVRDSVGSTEAKQGHLPCYLAFTASPEGGSKVCFSIHTLTFNNNHLHLLFYDGLGGEDLPKPSKVLELGQERGRLEEWCSEGSNATLWLEQINPGMGSLQDLSLHLSVVHISSPHRRVYLDEHCEQTHIVDDSAIRVTSRQNNSETSAPGHCRQTFTLAPSAQGERLMCLDFLMWPTPEKNCSYIHFYIYSGSQDSGKYDKYYNCSETPPNEWCVNNQSITIRLNRPPGGSVEPQSYMVMLDVMDRRLGLDHVPELNIPLNEEPKRNLRGDRREGADASGGASALSTAGIVIIALCLAAVIIVIIAFVVYNYMRKKNQPDEL